MRVTNDGINNDYPNEFIGTAHPDGELEYRRYRDHLGRSRRSAIGTLDNGTEPYLFADFQNAIYEIEGVATPVIEMFDGNAEWSSWDTSHIEPGIGYTGNGNASTANFIGDALTRVLTETTIIVEFESTVETADYPSPEIDMHSAGWEIEYSLTINGAENLVIKDFELGEPTIIAKGDITLGVHKIAITFENGRLAASYDGGAVVGFNSVPWTPAMAAFYLAPGGPVRSIALYPPQADADLPMLSAL